MTRSIVLSVALLLVQASLSVAQPTVTRATPDRIILQPGERPVPVSLAGEGLDAVTRVVVVRDDRIADGVTAILESAEPELLRLTLAADRTAAETSGLELRLALADDELPVPALRVPIELAVAPAGEGTAILAALPDHVRLEAGDKPAEVSIGGTGLDRIGSFEVFYKDEPAPGVTAAWASPPSEGKGILVVSAARESEPGEAYRVDAITRTDRIALPAVIEVVHLLKPDLAVVSCRVEPASPTTVDRIRFYAVVENQGAVSAEFPNVASRLASPELDPSVSIGGVANQVPPAFTLGSGATHDLEVGHVLPNGAGAGNYTLRVEADPDGLVAESDDADNVHVCAGTIVIALAAIPDLVISGVTFSPSQPTPVTGLQITLTMTNQGGADAVFYGGLPGPVVVGGTFIQDYYAGSPAITIAPGASRSFQIAPTNSGIQPGTRTFTFDVDPWDVVDESNESNNAYSQSVTIAPASGTPGDLAVVSCWQEPTSPSTVHRIRFYALLENRGAGSVVFPNNNWNRIAWPALSPFTGVSGVVNQVPALFTLAPGATHNLEVGYILPHTVPAGTYTLSVEADPDGLVAESDESNNVYPCGGSFLIAQGPTPDLVITGVTLSPTQPNPRTGLQVTIIVTNQGGADAVFPGSFPGPMIVQTNYTNYVYGSSSGLTIPAGASQSFQASATTAGLQPGTRTYTFEVDPSSFVPELSETNNTFSQSVTISP